MRRISELPLLLTLALSFACQEPDPHPPLLPACPPGDYCPHRPPSQVGGPSGSAGNSGTGGSGGVGGGGELRGTVVDLLDDTFVNGVAFVEPATIEAQSTTGAVVSANWNGIDAFTLTGVEASLSAWISVRPLAGIANVRTLHPVATHVGRNVDLGLVRADTVDGIFGILGVSTLREPGTAQIVLAFTVPAGSTVAGAAGVRAQLAEAELVAYESGGLWSSDTLQTDTSGLALIGNVPATAFPGSNKRITLGGLSSGFIDVRVAADAVSLVAVPLSP